MGCRRREGEARGRRKGQGKGKDKRKERSRERKGQGKGKVKETKGECVQSLLRGILFAKGVDMRSEESPLVGKMCAGWAGIGSRAVLGYGPLGGVTLGPA